MVKCILLKQRYIWEIDFLNIYKYSIEIMFFLISNLYTAYENVDHIIGFIKHNFFLPN